MEIYDKNFYEPTIKKSKVAEQEQLSNWNTGNTSFQVLKTKGATL